MQGRISKHFTWRELTRSATATRLGIRNIPSPEAAINLKRVVEYALEPARIHFGKPMRVNSGYRGPELNAAIGGSKTSSHMIGSAIDVEIPGVSNYDLAKWFVENLESFDQIILEAYSSGDPQSGWVHVSIREPGPGANRKQALTWSRRKGYRMGLIA